MLTTKINKYMDLIFFNKNKKQYKNSHQKKKKKTMFVTLYYNQFWYSFNQKTLKSATSTTFSQQIMGGKFLLVLI